MMVAMAGSTRPAMEPPPISGADLTSVSIDSAAMLRISSASAMSGPGLTMAAMASANPASARLMRPSPAGVHTGPHSGKSHANSPMLMNTSPSPANSSAKPTKADRFMAKASFACSISNSPRTMRRMWRERLLKFMACCS